MFISRGPQPQTQTQRPEPRDPNPETQAYRPKPTDPNPQTHILLKMLVACLFLQVFIEQRANGTVGLKDMLEVLFPAKTIPQGGKAPQSVPLFVLPAWLAHATHRPQVRARTHREPHI